MTTHIIADDVLAKVSLRFHEIIGRLLEGADAGRTLAALDLACADVPEPRDLGSTYGKYILECEWTWDNVHTEFATIDLEKCDSSIPFDQLLDPAAPEQDKTWLLGQLNSIFEAQIPGHGSHRMRRLYRVLSTGYFGYLPGSGFSGSFKRDVIDMHLILQPICEFDLAGQPIPCHTKG